jgi:predicted small secreted protein
METFKRRNEMRSFIRFALFVIAIFQLSACNTIAGMGDDIKKSADWTKEKITPVEIKK